MCLRDGDDRIFPRLNEINQEYRDAFKPLQGGLIYRKEFDECINAIKAEKSFIISGGAGYGKSGCTEAIIDYCKAENIPHIAIKLDRRIPKKNCEALLEYLMSCEMILVQQNRVGFVHQSYSGLFFV